jgi:hypothetical protein
MKNFEYNKGSKFWSLVGEYLPPVALHSVVIGVARKKKKKDESLDYSGPLVKWAVVNRVQLNLNCSDL